MPPRRWIMDQIERHPGLVRRPGAQPVAAQPGFVRQRLLACGVHPLELAEPPGGEREARDGPVGGRRARDLLQPEPDLVRCRFGHKQTARRDQAGREVAEQAGAIGQLLAPPVIPVARYGGGGELRRGVSRRQPQNLQYKRPGHWRATNEGAAADAPEATCDLIDHAVGERGCRPVRECRRRFAEDVPDSCLHVRSGNRQRRGSRGH
ncbi:MAG: hypothetical protein ACTHNK_16015 [Thermomicrobiales bacterium]